MSSRFDDPAEDAFLRAVAADPKDDTVCLVYADWLEGVRRAPRRVHSFANRDGQSRPRAPGRRTVVLEERTALLY